LKAEYLFYFCDGIGSVFDSQVLALLKAIDEKSKFRKIYLFLGIKNKNEKKELLDREAPPGIETVLFKSYPNYPLFNFLNRNSIQNALHNQNIILSEVIFHTRGEMIAWHLCKVLKNEYHKNILPDVRGASVEEIQEFYNFNKVMKSLKINNYKKSIKSINKLNSISVVSDSLKKYLVSNYQIDPEKIVKTPCLAGANFQYNESQREKIRKELNLSKDDILIVFSSGGTANWQNNDVLNMLAEKGLKVLNLSKKVISHKNVFNKFISYSEMPLYLNSADIAIIWRDKSIVNKVASPVKFSEYVCCGLPVIANYSVDMISEYITKHDCGILIDSFDDIEISTLNDLKQKDRKKISEAGILNFGIDSIVNQYFQTYSSIINF